MSTKVQDREQTVMNHLFYYFENDDVTSSFIWNSPSSIAAVA